MKDINFVAGLTIKEALVVACKTSVFHNEPVLAVINDIVMIVDKNTNTENALSEYHKKLEFKYEIEDIKREKQR